MRALVGVAGGIAAYKAPEVVRLLRARDHEVRCSLTRAGESFVAPLTLEVLSGAPVYREEYLRANESGAELHVEAAKWADVIAVLPTTAHTLARLALGLADDFLTTTTLAFQGPVVLAPAMHSTMWAQEAVRRNVEALRRRGAVFVGPVLGPLASGEVGMGRMAEPQEILAALEAAVGSGTLAGQRVLVTAGPTREYIDPVRFLSNRSSGRMGFALAAEAGRRGAEVILVSGPSSLPTPAGARRLDVETGEEMRAAVVQWAPSCHLVVMAAAVADYRPRRRAASKLKRRGGPPELDLVENPDILAELATLAPQAIRVGFAAETEDLESEAQRKLVAKDADFIVANDVSRADIGFDAEANEVRVFSRHAGPLSLPRMAKARLAATLLDLFAGAGAEAGRLLGARAD